MPSKQKFYLTLGISVLVLAFFVFALTLPLMERIMDQSNKYVGSKKKIVRIEKEIESLDSQKKALKEAKNSLLDFERAFLKVEQEETVKFISDLEEKANEDGIKIQITSVNISEIYSTFQVSLQGDFSDILHFIAFLEYKPQGFYRLVEIKKIDLKSFSAGDGVAEDEVGSEESEQGEPGKENKKSKIKINTICNLDVGVHINGAVKEGDLAETSN